MGAPSHRVCRAELAAFLAAVVGPGTDPLRGNGREDADARARVELIFRWAPSR